MPCGNLSMMGKLSFSRSFFAAGTVDTMVVVGIGTPAWWSACWVSSLSWPTVKLVERIGM